LPAEAQPLLNKMGGNIEAESYPAETDASLKVP